MRASKRHGGSLAVIVLILALAVPPLSAHASAGDQVDSAVVAGDTAGSDSTSSLASAGGALAAAACRAGAGVARDGGPALWGFGLVVCFVGILMELDELF